MLRKHFKVNFSQNSIPGLLTETMIIVRKHIKREIIYLRQSLSLSCNYTLFRTSRPNHAYAVYLEEHI